MPFSIPRQAGINQSTTQNVMEADPTSSFEHHPVMTDEVLRWLDPKPGQTVVDATVGCGGHAVQLAARLGPTGRLVGIDLDPEAIAVCTKKSKAWPCKTDLVCAGYDEIDAVMERLELETVDGIFADLGVSSPQIDRGERGFSFQRDGPLDMRMNPGLGASAAEWLAGATEREIRRVLSEYGEEIRAGAVARAIIRELERRPIETTGRLAEIVLSCFRDRAKAGRVHPATRTFQALRIVVNEELVRLERLLSLIPDRLGPGGRLVILAYHSLEDRLVKKALAEWSGQSNLVLHRVPIRGEVPGRFKVLTPKVVRPTQVETERNPRSRSARLRAAERTSLP